MNPRAPTSLPPDYFETLYAGDPDPWRFGSSDYERAKYAATLAALSAPRYADALEVGCSIGVLTARLADRCDRLLAVDAAAAPLAAARARCAMLPHVEFRQARLPAEWPDRRFDLILLSEVIYYWDRPDLERAAAKTMAALRAGGEAVLVHWTGETDYPLAGDTAAECFIAACHLAATAVRRDRTDHYRLDVLRRLDVR